MTNVSWLKIASGKAEPRFSADTIQRFFLEADRANRLTAPDIDTCKKVAMQLESILTISTLPLTPVSTETRKYARLTLQHLERDYAAIAALGASPQSMAGWDALIASVRASLAPIADASATNVAGGHIRAVAALARAAWRQAGDEPKAVAPDSPITNLVAAVLSLDADTVSRRLRARK